MRFLPTESIERDAKRVLLKTATLRIPVPIETVAHRLKLVVHPIAIGQDVSGILVVNNDTGVIGVNKAHPLVRRRFTIAHELAHFVLHRAISNLFIDKGFVAVFRDQRSSRGEERKEIQANQFAAALLMPRDLLYGELQESEFDLGEEGTVEKLAERFNVSTQSMMYRLFNLGTLPKPRAVGPSKST